MPQISVIVPIYKVEPYLCRCLDSILAQTLTDFELILVDDGSPDRCGAICDEYAGRDSRIHVIHQANGGLSAARNAALDWIYANSDSPWINCIDSDDWVHPRYLELLYKANMQYGTRISQCLHLMTDGTAEVPAVEERSIRVTVEEQYKKWYNAYAWGKLYHRDCFREIRYPVGKIYEDVSIWYKLLFAQQEIAVVRETLYYYFVRSDSIVGSAWTPAKLAQVEAWENQFEYVSRMNNPDMYHEALRRYCWVLRDQYIQIRDTAGVDPKQKKQHMRRLVRSCRKLLSSNTGFTIRNDRFRVYYDWAFPKLSWLYWTARGVKNKIRRILKR